MLKIEIQTIPHNLQNYDTVGNWFEDEEEIKIHVSELGNWKMEFLIALHEQIECVLCKNNGVSESSVTEFDISFTGNEPGEDLKAPYHKEHTFAEIIERMMADKLGIEWEEYEKQLENLNKKRP